jgi:acyl dehydratase
MPAHTAVARNFAEASENKIHSDDIAKRFGFTGALVPGVTVFGHLAWPVTRHFGERWLQGSWVTTRFIKPAYHGETISMSDSETDGKGLAVECRNTADVLLATLECTIESTPPPADLHAHFSGATDPQARVEITWDTVQVDEPFTTYTWQPDDACNREYAARVDDETELFRKGVLHPHAILSQANQVLVRRFVMPAWIHTGSEVRFRSLLRVGDAIEVRAVPLEKWERKGHQFIKLYVAYVVRGELATEIFHTAIFRVATK